MIEMTFILKTTFHEIPSHAMRGFIDHIGFHNCMINNIRPFAMGFADPAAYAITINSTMIQNVDSQVGIILESCNEERLAKTEYFLFVLFKLQRISYYKYVFSNL